MSTPTVLRASGTVSTIPGRKRGWRYLWRDFCNRLFKIC